MAVKDWKTNPDENTTISGIDIAEGCAPSMINNAIRQAMADLRTAYDEQEEKNKELETASTDIMKGATAEEAGESGRVPAPEKGKQEKPLCGGGSWADFLDCLVTGVRDTDGSAIDASKIVKKTGGEITGLFSFLVEAAFIAALGGINDVYGKRFVIDTYEEGKSGASLTLMKGDSSVGAGRFSLTARDALSTLVCSLVGTPDGILTWHGKRVIPAEVWQEPGGHGFYRIFDDGFCVQGALYDLGRDQSSFNVVVPLFKPLRSYAHFPLVVAADGNPQTNLCIANRTTTSFNAIGSPNYGANYTQRYVLWVDFGFVS